MPNQPVFATEDDGNGVSKRVRVDEETGTSFLVLGCWRTSELGEVHARNALIIHTLCIISRAPRVAG